MGPGLHPQYTSAFGEASGDPSIVCSGEIHTGSPGNIDFIYIGRVGFRVVAGKYAEEISFHLPGNSCIVLALTGYQFQVQIGLHLEVC